MDEETQRMIEQLAGGFPVQPTAAQPDKTKELSPEALAALFLVPGATKKYDYERNAVRPVTTVSGQSGIYDIVHDKNGKVGEASLAWDPTQKNVHVDYVSAPKSINSPGKSVADTWAHNLGTTEVRSLLKSLGNTFPEAETVEGLRISGARENAAKAALGRALTPGYSLEKSMRPEGYAGDTAKMRIPRALGTTNNAPGAVPGYGAPGQRLTDFW